ncbi:sigma-54 interaction domain-containing protein [Effusibacillus lacus]|uniref:HTH-type transcriptional regulatory protein TyrR n=1 Tax=Effusibacillus lacus TaxID=1348429 RepID=A0A292YMK3_9BACL|nr:sigma 54-interacting transcriptional regulator [Effusibacillus lacus]TCS70974.1 PAS domain S-box-containing protein [Effusibacillus lacus]GAX89993.1 sigma-54 specific transcriptional regulator [Effusibacillus lacus]
MEKLKEKQTAAKIDVGVALLDREGFVVYTNDTIKRWLGKSNPQLIKAGLELLIPNHRFSKVFASGKPMDWQMELGGMHLQINAYPYPNCVEKSGIFLVACNTVPLKIMQERLSEMKAVADELDAIFQNSYDAIYITDANGITLKTNDAIERLTGIPKEYYIGKDLRYLEKRGIVQKLVSFEVMKQKKPVTVIQENSLGKVLLNTGSPVFNEQGEVIRVVTNVRDISELNRLREELSQLRKFHAGEDQVVVASKEMERVIDLACRVAATDTTVLLLGESGGGKEVVARMIHRNSRRYEKGSFIKVNCGAIPQELLESELFGYESGAFTGAKKEGKPGMFELAHEGTLFLDEIGEMPLHLQVKLLRVLQEQEFHRVGGVKPIRVNVRIIAATNRDLKKMVAEGSFREDLYYRLYVVPIEIPPLRKRKEDILPLIQFYLDKFNRKFQTAKSFTDETLAILQRYQWPGNIRELANLIERLLVITPSHEIRPDHLPKMTGVYVPDNEPAVQEHAQNGLPPVSASEITYSLEKIEEWGGLQEAVEQLERQLLAAAYERYGSSYEVAKALKISQSTAIRKAYKYGIRIKSGEV